MGNIQKNTSQNCEENNETLVPYLNEKEITDSTKNFCEASNLSKQDRIENETFLL